MTRYYVGVCYKSGVSETFEVGEKCYVELENLLRVNDKDAGSRWHGRMVTFPIMPCGLVSINTVNIDRLSVEKKTTFDNPLNDEDHYDDPTN